MPLREFRVSGYRAWNDSGVLKVHGSLAIVGPNDAGKSGLLQGLQLLYEPPKRGGPAHQDFHGMPEDGDIVIEAAFDPKGLRSPSLQIDSKSPVPLSDGGLLDSKGYFRVRMTISSEHERLELLVKDVDDSLLMPLAFSDEDRLLSILQVLDLEAVAAGKETNQQKRQRIREEVLRKGGALVDQWVDASTHAREIRRVLPPFLYFPDSARYGASETGVQNQLRSVVDKAVRGSPGASEVEQEIGASIQAEVATLFGHFEKLTGAITDMRAVPEINWRKAVDDINLSWTDAHGVNLPYERRGAGMRRLFMVAYFQYEAMEWADDATAPRYIFAIEEPELHLHPGAQRELSETFSALEQVGHTVLYTTHSPVFVATASKDGTVLVRHESVDSEALQPPAIDAVAIARELGVDASDRLVGKNYVILVEGKHDVGFYERALRELHSIGATSLAPDSVALLHCGGIDSLEFSVTSRRMDEVGLKWALLIDSDRPAPGDPPSTQVQQVLQAVPSTCATARVLARTALENYLDPSAVSIEVGIACTVPRFGKVSRANGSPLSTGERGRLKTAVTRIAARMTASSIVSHSEDTPGQGSELATHFEAIRTAFGM